MAGLDHGCQLKPWLVDAALLGFGVGEWFSGTRARNRHSCATRRAVQRCPTIAKRIRRFPAGGFWLVKGHLCIISITDIADIAALLCTSPACRSCWSARDRATASSLLSRYCTIVLW